MKIALNSVYFCQTGTAFKLQSQMEDLTAEFSAEIGIIIVATYSIF